MCYLVVSSLYIVQLFYYSHCSSFQKMGGYFALPRLGEQYFLTNFSFLRYQNVLLIIEILRNLSNVLLDVLSCKKINFTFVILLG